MLKTWLAIGASLCFLSIALGAFAAHGLKAVLSEYQLGIVETGARYQMYHGLAIIIAAMVASHFTLLNLLNRVNIAFLLGCILFSGSLYLLALTEIKWFAYFTPIGGLSFLIAWLLFILMVFKIDKN